MELLLFWKDHWMDSWDAVKVASLGMNERRKYDTRYQWGDIVEVREDGYWATRGFDKAAFMVMKVPGMTYDADKMSVLYDGERFIRKRKWRANKANIPQNILNRVERDGRVVTITETQVNAFLDRKT